MIYLDTNLEQNWMNWHHEKKNWCDLRVQHNSKNFGNKKNVRLLSKILSY